MKRNKIAVIGLGNPLLSDEGAGLHALRLLKEKVKAHGPMEVDLIEAGTSGMSLLHQLEERKIIIFIDAGNCGIPSGEYKRFTPDEVISQKSLPNQSLHEFDLITFLEFAKRLGLTEQVEIVIYCIQAVDMEISEQPSSVVQKNLPLLVKDVFNEVVDLSNSLNLGKRAPLFIQKFPNIEV